MEFVVRHLRDSDVEPIVNLIYNTVHTINSKDYNVDQVNAWAPTLSADEQHDRTHQLHAALRENICFVADYGGIVVGFADITDDGYLDHLYVHSDYQGQGIASRLIALVEEAMRELGVYTLTTHASITAKTFFEAQGYLTVRPQTVMVRGVSMTNFKMVKSLNGAKTE